MNIPIKTIAAALSVAAAAGSAGAQGTPTNGDIERVLGGITWFGQSSIRIEANGKVLYVDPLHYRQGDKADVILITHLHQDHYVLANVKALSKPGTIVVAPVDLGTGNTVLKPGQNASLAGFPVEAVPAYNIRKTQFHPQAAGNDGYVITIHGVRVYHAGDTERIPEMKAVHADIALLPLGQTYTFDSVEEAADAAVDTGAKFAIPIHYGTGEGKHTDARRFADALEKRGVKTVILED